LSELGAAGRSGIVRIERERAKKQLVVARGAAVFAESSLPEEHLARVMSGMGLLPRAKIAEVGSLMKSGKTSEEAIWS